MQCGTTATSLSVERLFASLAGQSDLRVGGLGGCLGFASALPKPPAGTTPENPVSFQQRRYATQCDALDAGLLAGTERQHSAYLCTICGRWHLATKVPRGR